ncbi:MAG TPA: hypothetical protein VKB96_05400, partial [Gammaproteobacteria bacterium]|nr:hypothetical protein [Gammaproteobacteria bacterium]
TAWSLFWTPHADSKPPTCIALVCAGSLAAFNRNGTILAGFLIVFTISAGARFVSVYYLGRMHDPQPNVCMERV